MSVPYRTPEAGELLREYVPPTDSYPLHFRDKRMTPLPVPKEEANGLRILDRMLSRDGFVVIDDNGQRTATLQVLNVLDSRLDVYIRVGYQFSLLQRTRLHSFYDANPQIRSELGNTCEGQFVVRYLHLGGYCFNGTTATYETRRSRSYENGVSRSHG